MADDLTIDQQKALAMAGARKRMADAPPAAGEGQGEASAKPGPSWLEKLGARSSDPAASVRPSMTPNVSDVIKGTVEGRPVDQNTFMAYRTPEGRPWEAVDKERIALGQKLEAQGKNPATDPDFQRLTKERALSLEHLTSGALAMAGPTGAAKGAGAVFAGAKPAISAMAAEAEKAAAPVLSKAAGVVLKRLRQDSDAGGATAQDVLDQFSKARDANKPMTLADIGGANVKALAGSVSRQPGPGQNALRSFFEDRSKEAPGRIAGDINKGIGEGSAHDTAQALMKARADAAKPLYDEFRSAQPMNPEEIEPTGRIGSLLDRPAMKVGMANARKIAAEEGVDMNTLGITLDAEGNVKFAKTPTWRTIDYIKAGLDDVVEAYRDKVTGKLVLDRYGKAANETRQAFIKAVDDMNPAYAKARGSYAGPSQSLDALGHGEDILSRSPEEIRDFVKKLSPSDLEFYKLGAANTLRNSPNRLKPISPRASDFGNNIREKLRPLFKSDAEANKFFDSISAEVKMASTPREIMGGSQTAARQIEDESNSADIAVNALKGLGHALSGNVWQMAKHWLQAKRDLGLRPNHGMNMEIARILTTPATRGRSVNALLDAVPQLPRQNNLADAAPLYLPRAIGAGQDSDRQ